MENQKKCSNKKHSELNALNYCLECNIYLCNKCSIYHSEYLDTHHLYNIDINIQEIFTGLCKEPNHKNKLEFYCKTHNILCCAACLSKIKGEENGQHNECNVCLIKEIQEEKKNNLQKNIKYLKDFSPKIENSINILKKIIEGVGKNKEELKLKISNIFTKIRNIINEREDQLLLDVDNEYNNTFFKDDIIKKREKMPQQIKNILEKGKSLDNEWDNDDNKLINRINDCINIENNIKTIFEINENIEKYNSNKINIKFFPEDEKIISELSELIKKYGEIVNISEENFMFKFKSGNNINITNNGLIAKKSSGGYSWNCVIIGDKEIPKNKISKWKIRLNKIGYRYKDLSDIHIGIGPSIINGNLYDKCWSIYSHCSKMRLNIKGKSEIYNNLNNQIIKEGDIIEVIVDRKLGNLSFSLNDINLGLACSSIPKEEALYPAIVSYEQGLIVEII